MTTSRTKPLSFLETKMTGLEESTYVDLILVLHYGADEWGQHPIQELKNAASSHSTFSSLKDTLSSLSLLDMAHIVSKNPT